MSANEIKYSGIGRLQLFSVIARGRGGKAGLQKKEKKRKREICSRVIRRCAVYVCEIRGTEERGKKRRKESASRFDQTRRSSREIATAKRSRSYGRGRRRASSRNNKTGNTSPRKGQKREASEETRKQEYRRDKVGKNGRKRSRSGRTAEDPWPRGRNDNFVWKNVKNFSSVN